MNGIEMKCTYELKPPQASKIGSLELKEAWEGLRAIRQAEPRRGILMDVPGVDRLEVAAKEEFLECFVFDFEIDQKCEYC